MINKKDQIITERLVLKSLEDCDEKEAISIFENPLVSKTYMSPVFHNDEERRKYVSTTFLQMKEISSDIDNLRFTGQAFFQSFTHGLQPALRRS